MSACDEQIASAVCVCVCVRAATLLMLGWKTPLGQVRGDLSPCSSVLSLGRLGNSSRQLRCDDHSLTHFDHHGRRTDILITVSSVGLPRSLM